jgi:hypothetical protein
MRAALALLVALTACGASGPTVCDDSDDLRLAVRYQPGGALVPGEHVLYDNGASFLFVDGRCTVHVKTGGGRWEDVRRGTADDATLVADLQLDQLAEHAGAYAGELADAATLRIGFEGAVLTCSGGCTGDDLPEWLIDLNAHAAALMTDLQEEATAATLAQRVLVVDQAVPPTPAFLWPASFDPATIAVLRDAAATAPATLVEGADGDALRTLRHDVRDAEFPPGAAYITTDDTQPPSYAAYLRDALPYEDAAGLVADP